MAEATLQGGGGRVARSRVTSAREALRTSRAKTQAGKSRRLAKTGNATVTPTQRPNGKIRKATKILREEPARTVSGQTAKNTAASRKGKKNRATPEGIKKTKGILRAARRQGRPVSRVVGP